MFIHKCIKVVYFALFPAGSCCRAVNYCLDKSSSTCWLAYWWQRVGVISTVVILCRPENEWQLLNIVGNQGWKSAEGQKSEVIPVESVCVPLDSQRSEVRVSSGTACKDSVCWSKGRLRAGCLLTQLLGSTWATSSVITRTEQTLLKKKNGTIFQVFVCFPWSYRLCCTIFFTLSAKTKCK